MRARAHSPQAPLTIPFGLSVTLRVTAAARALAVDKGPAIPKTAAHYAHHGLIDSGRGLTLRTQRLRHEQRIFPRNMMRRDPQPASERAGA